MTYVSSAFLPRRSMASQLFTRIHIYTSYTHKSTIHIRKHLYIHTHTYAHIYINKTHIYVSSVFAKTLLGVSALVALQIHCVFTIQSIQSIYNPLLHINTILSRLRNSRQVRFRRFFFEFFSLCIYQSLDIESLYMVIWPCGYSSMTRMKDL